MEVIKISDFVEFHDTMQRFANINFLFRGQLDADWGLVPKVGRDAFKDILPSSSNEELLLDSWKRYAGHLLTSVPIDNWDWLSLAQHHGLATRLLDWTKNPLVALYFATEDYNSGKDASVFVYDFKNEDSLLQNVSPFNITSSGVFYPKGLTARVISQRGIFSISHLPSVSLDKTLKGNFYKLIIKGKSKRKIHKHLEQYGLNEYSIYQDLDSLSDYLNRFVIDRNNIDVV